MTFLVVAGILTWKCINHLYILGVYTLNPAEKPFCLYEEKTYDLTFMLSFGLQNIKPAFLLTSKHVNGLGRTLLLVCLLGSSLFLIFFAVYFVIASAALIFLHFNLQKIIRTMPLGFSLLFIFFATYFEVFKR